MHLDMLTMSAVSVALTAILGIGLVFTWARAGGTPFVGLWGVALLTMSGAIVLAAAASAQNLVWLLALGQAAMILADAIKWQASRLFAHRRAILHLALLGPVGFLVAAYSGYFPTFDDRLVLACALIAAYNFAAAAELSYANGEHLISRWPAVALLILTGIGFLSWLPLISSMPIREANAVFSSSWFPGVVLVALLIRTALAFVVLSMAKERQELEQRVDALTDSLTGLPNRRALFEATDELGERRDVSNSPISVLLFDLDHFKLTNDTYGHEVGDRVLKVFARTLSETLDAGSIVARLGGEEFAAVLPGSGPVDALDAAESVRHAFAESAADADGLALGSTVSVGVASDPIFDNNDLSGLFRRADAALYVAKRAGRNRVELLGPEDADAFDQLEASVRGADRRRPVVPPRPMKIGAQDLPPVKALYINLLRSSPGGV